MTNLYQGSEGILNSSETVTNKIHDTDIKNTLLTNIENAKNTATNNIELLSFFYQYSWLIVVVITLVVMMLLARRVVERDRL